MTGAKDPARGDAILWQWPGGPWERLRKGPATQNAGRWEIRVFILGGFFAVAWIMFGVPDGKTGSELLLPLLLTFAAAIAWIFGFFNLYLGYNRVSQLTLTVDEIHHAIGFPWPRHETIARADIRSVVVYEGDGTILLLGEAGELLRTRHLAEATVFAEALDAPTVVWPVRASVDPAWWTIYLALWLGVAAVPMFSVAAYPGALLGIGVLMLLSDIVDLAGSNSGLLLVLFIMMPVFLLTFVLALPLALFLAIAAGRFLFKPETLHGLLHAMCGSPLHADGCVPPSRTSHRPPLTARYTTWCARLVGIAPPPPLHPDLRHRMTPQAAQAAMALAEGRA